MSDPKTLPVRADLQATFRDFMPRLAASFGIEPSAIQPHLTDLSTADKLVAAAAFITANPIFQAGYRMDDGSVMRQIGIAAEMMKTADANGDEVLIGIALKMIFFHPNIGEPRMIGAIVISYDDVAVTTMGGSITQLDQSGVGYDQGKLTQLLSILPPDASGDMAVLYTGMVKALKPVKGSASEQIRDAMLAELQPFANAAQQQKQLPAPSPEADLKAPLSVELVAVLPELMRMADETLGIDPAAADSLSTAFYALVSDLNSKKESLTPTTLASLLDTRDGLKFILNMTDGKISSCALAFDLTNDAGDVIDRFALGISSDVVLPAAFNCSGLTLVIGDPDENAYDAQLFSVFAKAGNNGLSAEKAQENRNMVIRALTAFYPFSQEDAEAEALRRQAVRLLRTVLAQ